MYLCDFVNSSGLMPSLSISEPTNASRLVLKKLLAESGLQHIIGKGYYAFMNVGEYIRSKGWADTEPLGQYLAENHGVAIVPGAFFSPFGGEWVRFSYATSKFMGEFLCLQQRPDPAQEVLQRVAMLGEDDELASLIAAAARSESVVLEDRAQF